MGYLMVEGYPLVFTRDNYFYWNKQEKIFWGGKGALAPQFRQRSTEKGARVLSPPNIWSHDRQQLRNGARLRKTAQNGAKRRKTAQNGAKRRKTRKTAQNGAKRRKTAQNGARWRKIGDILAGPNWGGGKSLAPFLNQSLSKIGGHGPLSPLKILFLISSWAQYVCCSYVL